MPDGDKKKVVIVGAGAAGCFTAYLLKKNAPDDFEVQLLEMNPVIGGHTRSFQTTQNGETVNIDSGAQFFSDTAQPDYVKLLQEEGFFAQPGTIIEADVGVTVWDVTNGQTELRVPARLADLLGSAIDDPVRWLLFGAFTSAAFLHYHLGDWKKPFGEWLKELVLPAEAAEVADFKKNVARPLMYQFGLIEPDRLDELSAKFVVYYYVGSLSLNLSGPFRIYNSAIGLDGILEQLLDKVGVSRETSTKVNAVVPQPGGGYQIQTSQGPVPADEVVFATNPPWTRALLPAGVGLEGLPELLDRMKYVTVPVAVDHPTSPYMPTDPAEWSASNVLVVKDPAGDPTHYMLSVWFGPLRPQPIAASFFKSWGSPQLEPPLVSPFHLQTHRLMIGTPDFIAARQLLRSDWQGKENLWYVGGYILDYDCQNTCLKSARDVVTALLQKHSPQALAAPTAFFAYPMEAPPSFAPEPDFAPSPYVPRRPALVDEIEQKLIREASDHPTVRRWLETRDDDAS